MKAALRIASAVTVLILATPVAAEELVQSEIVVLMPLSGNTLPKKARRALDNRLAAKLAAMSPYRVVALRDIEAEIGLERVKDLVGCDDVKCAAEIAGPLDARYLAHGTVRAAGRELLISLNLIDVRSLEPARRGQGRTRRRPEYFDYGLEVAVRTLLEILPVPTPPWEPAGTGADMPKEVTSFDPAAAIALYWEGQNSAKAGQWSRAIPYYERCLRADKRVARCWFSLGHARARVRENKKAYEALRHYLTLEPDGDGSKFARQFTEAYERTGGRVHVNWKD